MNLIENGGWSQRAPLVGNELGTRQFPERRRQRRHRNVIAWITKMSPSASFYYYHQGSSSSFIARILTSFANSTAGAQHHWLYLSNRRGTRGTETIFYFFFYLGLKRTPKLPRKKKKVDHIYFVFLRRSLSTKLISEKLVDFFSFATPPVRANNCARWVVVGFCCFSTTWELNCWPFAADSRHHPSTWR